MEMGSELEDCPEVDVDEVDGIEVVYRASEGDAGGHKGRYRRSPSCSRSQKFESRDGSRFPQFAGPETGHPGLPFQHPFQPVRTRPQTSLQSTDAECINYPRGIGLVPAGAAPAHHSGLKLNFDSVSQMKRANALSMYIPRGQRNQIGVNMIQRLLRNVHQN